MRVTCEELAGALNRARVTVRDPKGLVVSGASGLPPEASVTEVRGPVKYPDETAQWLLEAIESHRAAEGDPPAAADPELAALDTVRRALEPLDPAACSRVLDWARRRFAVDVPF